MNIKTLPVGQLETNCYVITNAETLGCVIIDPGDESNTVLDYVEDCGARVCAVMLTHGHYDHVGAVREVAEQTGVRYLDTLSVLMGSDGWLPQDYQNGDGLHLNPTSFNLVLNNIRTHGWN